MERLESLKQGRVTGWYGREGRHVRRLRLRVGLSIFSEVIASFGRFRATVHEWGLGVHEAGKAEFYSSKVLPISFLIGISRFVSLTGQVVVSKTPASF